MRKKDRKAADPQKIATILVRRAPRLKTRAILQFGPLRLPAAIGRSGTRAIKREGDGATPIASMALLYGYVRRDRGVQLVSGLDLAAARPAMLWCDESRHASYNRPVKAPFTPSHETLCRDDRLYDIVIVLDWNIRARARNRGSAIFFHLTQPDFTPTAGCIAIDPGAMRRLLPHLRRGQRLVVV